MKEENYTIFSMTHHLPLILINAVGIPDLQLSKLKVHLQGSIRGLEFSHLFPSVGTTLELELTTALFWPERLTEWKGLLGQLTPLLVTVALGNMASFQATLATNTLLQ